MSLCARCIRLVPKWVDLWDETIDSSMKQAHQMNWHGMRLREPTWVMHSSWESFCSSLDQNCPICWSLWRYIRSSPLATPAKERYEAFQCQAVNVVFDPSMGIYKIDIGLEGVGAKDGVVHFNMEDGFLDEEPWQVSQSPTVDSISNYIKNWLNCCLKTHDNCKQVSKAKRRARSKWALPSRLIDLGDHQSKQWRIVRTEGKSRKYRKYCALSHRWSDNTPRLTSENLEEYETYQAQGQFTQDYEDVMALCRALSIRYLWIDSLCILQDSAEDFNHEAATMMDIYTNAIITFSICWDCSDAGLFSERNRGPNAIPGPMPPSPRRVNYLGSLSNIIPRQVKNAFAHPQDIRQPKCLLFGPEWEINVSDALVNTRGWVLQEKILSARVVYLGNDQLYWECHDCRISESEPHGIYISAGPRQGLYLRTNQTDWLARTSWPETIETYTDCELTYEEDRLIAISGLARCFGRVFRSEYLAGIWADFWIYDLLWDPASAHEERHISRFHRFINSENITSNIPSWSWASFPGPVKMHRSDNLTMKTVYNGLFANAEGTNRYESDEQMPLAILTKSTITPPESDPFGNFERASLECRCYLIPLDFDRVKNLDNFREVSSSSGKVRLSLHEPNDEDGPFGLPNLFDDPDGENGPFGLPGIKLAVPRSRKERDTVDVCFSKPLDPCLPCFLLPLYIEKRSSPVNEEERRPTRGLIVQEQISTPRGVNEGRIRSFIRIGTFMEAPTVMYGLSRVMINTIAKRNCILHGQEGGGKRPRLFQSTLYFLAGFLSIHEFRKDWSIFTYFEVDWALIRLV